MAIKETSVFTRANTSVNWPGENYTPSSNNLLVNNDGNYFTRTITVSDDGLTQTNIKIWASKEKFIEAALSVSVNDRTNWLTVALIDGITIVNTIENL
jgi:hypothetical protein